MLKSLPPDPARHQDSAITLGTQRNRLSWHDYLADRPERYSSKLQMRPSERNAYDGDSEEHCSDKVAKC